MKIAGWLPGCNRWDSTCCSQPASWRSSSSAILIANDLHLDPQRSSSSAILIAGSRYAMRPSHACTQILIHTRAMCGDRAHGPASGGAPRGSVWPLPCGGCVRQVLAVRRLCEAGAHPYGIWSASGRHLAPSRQSRRHLIGVIRA